MNRAEIVKTLELVKPALAANNTIPIFQCFNFNEGSVSAYNDTIAIIGPADFDWACAINGTTLLGLLSNSKAEELEIKLDRDTATLKLGKTVSKMPFFTHEEMIFTAPDDSWEFQIPFTESLAGSIAMCLETVSTDETQLALHGVTIEGNKLFSCNGDTVTRIQIKKGIKGRVLMPTAFCSAVLKLWSALEMTKGTIQFSNEWVFANLGEWAVYGRILEVNDPINFDDLIKRTIKSDPTTQQVPDGFSEALSRARVLSDPESKKTSITVAKNKLIMHTETHMGEIHDILPLQGHLEVEARVNASHLQRALQHCDKLAIHENCVIFEKGDDVLQLVSNMD